jgi:hypothetical protein
MSEELKAPRSEVEILQMMIGQQAGLIARLQSVVERMPAIKAELDELRATVAALAKPEAPET